MDDSFNYHGYTINKIYLESEVNYIVHYEKGYYCRLVPGYIGFELSKVDKAIENEVDQDLITELSDYIVRKDA